MKKFEEITSDINTIKSSLEKVGKGIEDLKIIVAQIKNNIDDAVRIMEQYYEIDQDIISRYEFYNIKYMNYQVLKTVRHLDYSKDFIMKDLFGITEGEGDLGKNEAH